jgi:dGTPase
MNWNDRFLNNKRFRDSGTDGKRELLSDNTDKRTPAESDFGRVVFSPACRRLHDKTQVFPLTTNDNIHSRLTHSLEVMNMGMSFAIDLSMNPAFLKSTGLNNIDVLRDVSAILKTSCLVHDIGNPPFGHFGEVVIQDYFKRLFKELKDKRHPIWKGIEFTDYLTKDERTKWESYKIEEANSGRKAYIENNLEEFLSNGCEDWRMDYTEFDGNAEGFRILTRLQNVGDLYGLNLTYGTLAATIKYPNTGKGDKTGRIGEHKHGVMFTERILLHDIAKACHLEIDGQYFRHPLAFLMEAADSICYLVMDIDDAIKKQWIELKEIEELVQKCDEPDKSKIIDSYKQILAGNKSPRKKWMSMRTAILGFLMKVAVMNFVDNLKRIEEGNFNHELINLKCSISSRLQDFCKNRILSNRHINLLETTGRSVICGLFDEYVSFLFHPEKKFRDKAKVLLSRSILYTVIMEHIRDHRKEYGYKYGSATVDEVFDRFDLGDLTVEERFRIIRDYVAGMTDKFALNHYQELSGQRLS